jgi:hypothetical protein
MTCESFEAKLKAKIQMAFNEMFEGLRNQDFRQSTRIRTGRWAGGSVCSYRGMNGRKCAIGHLIPTEKYSSSLELVHGGVSNPAVYGSLPEKYGAIEDGKFLDFLIEAQYIHDRSRVPKKMQDGLRLLASTYHLTIPE